VRDMRGWLTHRGPDDEGVWELACPLEQYSSSGPPLFLWRGEIFLSLIAKVTFWHCQSVTLGHFEIKKVNIISYAIKKNLALDIFNVKGSMILRGASFGLVRLRSPQVAQDRSLRYSSIAYRAELLPIFT